MMKAKYLGVLTLVLVLLTTAYTLNVVSVKAEDNMMDPDEVHDFIHSLFPDGYSGKWCGYGIGVGPGPRPLEDTPERRSKPYVFICLGWEYLGTVSEQAAAGNPIAQYFLDQSIDYRDLPFIVTWVKFID